MKALLLFGFLGTSAMFAADEHPTPAAVATSPQGSLYAFDSTWTNQLGKKVEWKASAGTTRIVALGYATCKGICPRIIGDMQRIEMDLSVTEKERCRFTFVSVDPEHDKVADLKALGERHKIEDTSWDLLNGGSDSVLELAVALGVRYDRLPNGVEFAHSYLITVIGPDGIILHKWSEPAEGPGPSVEAIRKCLAK